MGRGNPRRSGRLSGHKGVLQQVRFHRTGSCWPPDMTTRQWAVGSGDGPGMRRLKGHEAGITSIAFSPDGKTLASAGRSVEPVRLWIQPPARCASSCEAQKHNSVAQVLFSRTARRWPSRIKSARCSCGTRRLASLSQPPTNMTLRLMRSTSLRRPNSGNRRNRRSRHSAVGFGDRSAYPQLSADRGVSIPAFSPAAPFVNCDVLRRPQFGKRRPAVRCRRSHPNGCGPYA